MVDDILIPLKPFILIVVAIPMGLFVRTIGQFFIDWAKEPTERAKKDKHKRDVCFALLNTIGNARQYCEQMHEYLQGVPAAVEGIDAQLLEAARQAGRILVVPTFNLDLAILEAHSAEIFSLFAEEQAQSLLTTRLQLAHVRRRVDTIADFMFSRGDERHLSDFQRQFIVGTRGLIEGVIQDCANTREMVQQVGNGIPARPPRNFRPWLVFLIMVALVAAVIYAARLPDAPAKTISDPTLNGTQALDLPKESEKKE